MQKLFGVKKAGAFLLIAFSRPRRQADPGNGCEKPHQKDHQVTPSKPPPGGGEVIELEHARAALADRSGLNALPQRLEHARAALAARIARDLARLSVDHLRLVARIAERLAPPDGQSTESGS